ncbi:MAG: Holliday junction resolvase RuvX [Planctomycetaceae bacterium]|jgi:putative Holliday junction resolvase|nr:Holliday junction resolvase RuvX [Planctomycetaceae bacterium]
MSTDTDNIETPKGRIAAIDYGTVRIGIAICDYDRILASPYEIYTRKNDDFDAKYFKHFVQNEQVIRFVVGLPLKLDGQLGGKAKEALAFGKWLSEQTGVETVYYDERYTSVEAEQFLLEANFSRKKRKKRIDKVAAQIFLRAYLEAGCRNTVETLPLDG